MPKKINEEFLTAYKEFEEALKTEDQELTVYEYASRMQDAKKLQLCRLVRNFLSHQSDEFVVPTKEMVSYLKELTRDVVKMRQNAKDIMTRTVPLDPGAKISDAAEKLGPKKPFLVVCDKDRYIIGLFTRETVRKAVVGRTQSKTIKTAGGLEKADAFVSPDTPAKEISAPVIVTSDGTAKGTYKGVIY